MRLSFVVLLLFVTSVEAFEHFALNRHWQTIESANVIVTFPEERSELANRAITISETLLPQLETFFDWEPESKVQIVLSDQSDQANGYATPFPYNRSVLFTALPSGTSELSDYGEWFDLLILHELTHIVHLDKARDFSYAPRYVLGRNLFTFSNLFQPNFFKEGIATYTETSWANGAGRGQSAFYQMVMRSEVSSGLLPLSKVQQSTRDWPLNKDYSYGVPFYQFLDEEYGRDSIQRYVNTTSGQLIPFVVDRPARHSTQASGLAELWEQYLEWLNKRYTEQLAQLSPTQSEFERLTTTGYFNTSPFVSKQGDIYYVAFDPYGPAFIKQIMPRPTQSGVRSDVHPNPLIENVIVRAKIGTRIIGANIQYLWYLQPSACTHNTSSTDLYRVDIATGDSEKLTKCAHYLNGAISNNKLITVKQSGAKKSLVLVDLASLTEKIVVANQGFNNIDSPIWLNDDAIAYSYKPHHGNWRIDTINLTTNTSSTILESDKNNYFEVASGRNADSMFVTSDKEGLMDLWEYSFNTNSLSQLTQSVGGAIAPSYNPITNNIVYQSYSDQGWDIASTRYSPKNSLQASASPNLTPIQLDKPGEGYEIDWSQTVNDVSVPREYSPWSTLAPRTWFPGYISDNAQSTALLTVTGRDALNFHNWSVTSGRDFENDVNLFQIRYTAYNHLSALYSRDYDYETDSASAPPAFIEKTTVIETREDAALVAQTVIPFDFSNLLLFGGYNQQQRDTEYFLSPPSDFKTRIKTVGIGASYSSASTALYGISPAHGRSIKFNLERDQVKLATSTASTRQSYGNIWYADWTEYIALYEAHTLALRAMIGEAQTGADAFDLADAPSGTVYTQALVHRREFPLRAYPDGTPELIGKKPAIYSADYRFPIANIDQGLTAWPIGLHSISGALFYESGTANRDDSSFDSAGLELHAGIDIGYSALPVAVRVGIAVPFEKTLAAPKKDANVYIGLGYSL